MTSCRKSKRITQPQISTLIQRVYEFAAKAHDGQLRRSGDPYVVHPLGVARDHRRAASSTCRRCARASCTTASRTPARPPRTSRRLFGAEIAVPRRRRHQARQDSVEHTRGAAGGELPQDAAGDGARHPRHPHQARRSRRQHADARRTCRAEKQERIARETMEIYAPLANRLGIQWMKVELEDLAFRYLEPEEYAALVDKLQRDHRSAQTLHRRGRRACCKDELAENEHRVQVYGPRQAPLVDPPEDEEDRARPRADLRHHRVPRDRRDRCATATRRSASCTRKWTPVPGRFKDFIALPKPNMYQSLHTTVIGPRGERMEVQIRTQEMHRDRRAGHRGALAVQGRRASTRAATTRIRSASRGCAS